MDRIEENKQMRKLAQEIYKIANILNDNKPYASEVHIALHQALDRMGVPSGAARSSYLGAKTNN